MDERETVDDGNLIQRNIEGADRQFEHFVADNVSVLKRVGLSRINQFIKAFEISSLQRNCGAAWWES